MTNDGDYAPKLLPASSLSGRMLFLVLPGRINPT